MVIPYKEKQNQIKKKKSGQKYVVASKETNKQKY